MRRRVQPWLLFLLTVFIAVAVQAAPLRFYPVTVTQPTGESIHCFASGDEFHNWLHDANNYTIMQDPNSGTYVYATLVRGVLTPSTYVAGKTDPASVGLTPGINLPAQTVLARRNAMMKTAPAEMGMAPQKGTINNLIVFIRFNDDAEYTDLISVYDYMFNGAGGSANSMYGYFKEVSYDKLTVNSTFYPAPSTTVVSYQDANPRGYYMPYATNNRTGYSDETARTSREHTMLLNAVNAIAPGVPAGLNIDSDNDGRVDNVCFIVAGDVTAWSTLLWPHRWSLFSVDATINGKRVWDYNFQIQKNLGNSSYGVGTLCHEMFHSVGAPDLYHYTDNGITSVGAWDVMDGTANPAQHMGAYMKLRYGKWLDSIPTIATSGTYTINTQQSPTGNAYKIPSPNSTSEYFIVEFRKRTGVFENSLPGTGLLVYRINKVSDGVGNRNGPPDEVYLYRPNGTTTVNGNVPGAYMSSEALRNSIMDGGNPNPFLNDGSPGGLKITNIGSSAGNTISFTVTLAGQDSSTTVIAPNGGEKWATGTTQQIKWKAPKITNAKLEYSTNNGSTWSVIVASTPASAGMYLWTIPSTVSTQCLVRVSDAANATEFDMSDKAFTIAQGQLGESWSAQTSGVTAALSSVSMIDNSIAWAGGVGGVIVRTTNGGATWMQVTSISGDVYNIKGISATRALVTTSGTSTQIFLTTNGGGTWSAVYTQTGGFIDAIDMFDATNGYAIGDPVGGNWTLIKTADGGATWTSATTLPAVTGEAGWNNSSAWIGNTGWFGTNLRRVYKTTDRGATWAAQATPDSNSVSIAAADASTVFAGLNNGKIDATTNGGTTWAAATAIPSGTASVASMMALGAGNVWSIGSGIVYKTTNNGTSWSPAYSGSSVLYDMDVYGNTSGATGYVVGAGGSIIAYFRGMVVPEVTVVAPNGGESLTAGGVSLIQWNAIAVKSVKIEFSSNNGSTWSTVGYAASNAKKPTGLLPGEDGLENDNSVFGYSWSIPNVATTQGLIRVSDSSNASVSDVSNAVFTIKSANGPALAFSYNLTTAGVSSQYGAEFDGTNFYASVWNSTSGEIARISKTGTFIDKRAVTGVTSGFRDLAWDGKYLYGGSNGAAIYQIDPVTSTLVATIPATGQTVRGIAYNGSKDAFYVAGWSTNIVLLSRTGAVLQTITAATHGLTGIAGLAYDSLTAGGPYIWAFNGGDTTTVKKFYRLNAATGAQVDNFEALQGISAPGAIAGGCFFTSQYQTGKFTVGAINQGTPGFLFGWNIGAPTGVTLVGGTLPQEFAMDQNYPNPFNPSTTLRFALPQSSHVRLAIYNAIGQLVETVLDGVKEAGNHSVSFDASRLSSGVYFYTLDAGAYHATKKMVLMR
ncbi:MAG: M6 family metalloprotease domain-containing protein [Ignavibacteriales bacterium]|nr:M6 family metalloprotease domain-containing protein [Ignavibacteriales bacterium]